MSIRNIINRLSPRDGIDVTRFNPGNYSGGIWSNSVNRRFRIKASVQPMSQNNVLASAENLTKLSSMLHVYSSERLLTNDRDSNQRGDVLTIDGKNYEVMVADHWRGPSLSHYRYTCEKVR